MSRAAIQGLLEMLGAAPRPGSIAELRAIIDVALPFLNANPPEVGQVHEAVAVSDGVQARVLVPRGTPPFPVLVYLHGGGWSIGSSASHHQLACQLCAGAGAVVVNVDYRLAPEHPFPTPLDDCIAAARWARANAARWGGDPERVALGGDSAGANLSVAVVNDLRHEMRFRGALLFYGAFDLLACRRDYDRWAPVEDPVLPRHSMDLMIDAYLGGGASTDDPRVSPIRADLSHFPPACVVCGGWDPLFGESRALAEKLAAAGRVISTHWYEEMPHGFVQLPAPEADEALALAGTFLRRVLG